MPCPRCGQKAPMVATTTRFHFCFIPLWKEGGVQHAYYCSHCGAQYPA